MKFFLIFGLLAWSSFVFSQTTTYSIVFLNKNPDKEQMSKAQVDKIMEGHMANIERLAKEGKLLAAGPFEGGGGIFILNTASPDDARQWLSTDPGVQANRWKIEILPYKSRIGAVCKAPEPYEMVMYDFIRFDAVISKFTARDYPHIFEKHDAYIKQLAATGNVVTAAVFGDHDGGILIIKGTLQKDVIEADPGVQAGLLELQFKKLYIAKGSFCE